MNTHIKPPRARVRALAAALLVPLAMGACSNMLDVKNPTVIQGSQLNDPAMVPVMANGVEAQFQRTFNSQALYMSIISDELMDSHVYQPEHEWDSRNISSSHSYVKMEYNTVHALRGAADTLGARMATLLGDKASSNVDLAKVRAFGGWAYLMLGENFCASPIDGSAAYSDKELLDMAIAHFDEAISIAQAAQAGATDTVAAYVLNLARVGAARAALDAGETDKAVAYAQQVPADFVYWAEYSDNSAGQTNDFYDGLQNYDPNRGDVRWIGLDSTYVGLNDLRIPQTDSMLSMMDTRAFYVPFQPESFSGWKADGTPVKFTKSDAIRVASGLEARYIIQEVQGPTLAFLNERRAVGGQPALTALPADGGMAELRDQRRRDLFMDTHRFADMRRYKEQYGIDLFQELTGPYPGIANTLYGDAECIPISQNEIDNNPNL